jgi:hypothetical protein
MPKKTFKRQLVASKSPPEMRVRLRFQPSNYQRIRQTANAQIRLESLVKGAISKKRTLKIQKTCQVLGKAAL